MIWFGVGAKFYVGIIVLCINSTESDARHVASCVQKHEGNAWFLASNSSDCGFRKMFISATQFGLAS